MFETIGKNPKCQRLCLGLRLDGRVSIGEHARQLDHFRDPPIIGLSFKLNTEVHSGRIPHRFCDA